VVTNGDKEKPPRAKKTGRSGKSKLFAGRYRVLRTLGKGGQGRVYQVWDEVAGEKRAMKVLRQRWQLNERVIARFAREVETLRRLDHPGILKIYDARKEGEIFFYVMEYVRGKSIRDWVRDRKQLQFSSVVRVLCLVADILEHAHEFTVHRDISPDNVMILPDGSVRLLDFGLAKLDDNNPNLTMVGYNMGKIQYNAPEQQVNASEVDGRADIYPLGIMFFEMLTGNRPHGKSSLLGQRPDLPASCEDFWRKATEPLPEDRFQDARSFSKELLDIYRRSQGLGRSAEDDTITTPPRFETLLRNCIQALRRLFRRG
jgi:eukaryotic-like serine/threonine-protein kinase